MRQPIFSIYQDKAGEWRFRLKAKNGEIIAVGEGYKTKQGCIKGVETVKENSLEAIIMVNDEVIFENPITFGDKVVKFFKDVKAKFRK